MNALIFNLPVRYFMHLKNLLYYFTEDKGETKRIFTTDIYNG
jgi:hypothetical protein